MQPTFLCTDCHLPATLDDVVETFTEGTCRCLPCDTRATAGDRQLTPTLRRELADVLAGLDAA